jgi:hypothetical protein
VIGFDSVTPDGIPSLGCGILENREKKGGVKNERRLRIGVSRAGIPYRKERRSDQ